MGMTLKDYLTAQNLNAEGFAKIIGASKRSVEYYLTGRVPRKATLEHIKAVTEGKVTPNDFFGDVQ